MQASSSNPRAAARGMASAPSPLLVELARWAGQSFLLWSAKCDQPPVCPAWPEIPPCPQCPACPGAPPLPASASERQRLLEGRIHWLVVTIVVILLLSLTLFWCILNLQRKHLNKDASDGSSASSDLGVGLRALRDRRSRALASTAAPGKGGIIGE